MNERERNTVATRPLWRARCLRERARLRWTALGQVASAAVASALCLACVVYPAQPVAVAPPPPVDPSPAATDASAGEVATESVPVAASATAGVEPVPIVAPTIAVEGAPTDIIDFALGENHTCVLSRRGEVRCWGYNKKGELGIGAKGEVASGQVQGIASSGERVSVRAIASGGYQSCALRSDGAVYCWGMNLKGQVGSGAASQDPVRVPVQVRGLPPARAIFAGDSMTCAIVDDGSAWCWGDNSQHAIEGSSRQVVASPTRVAGGSKIDSIAIGNYHLCLLAAGRVSCTGKMARHNAALAALPTVTAISAGWEHSCAIAGGEVYCWGSNYLGVLGFDDRCAKKAAPSPRQTRDSDHDNERPGMYQRERKEDFSAAALQEVACTKPDRYGPTKVLNGNSAAVALSGHDYHTCALAKSGAPICWGNNQGRAISSELPAEPYARPTQLRVAGQVERVMVGGVHTCVLARGALACHGNDWAGAVSGEAHPR